MAEELTFTHATGRSGLKIPVLELSNDPEPRKIVDFFQQLWVINLEGRVGFATDYRSGYNTLAATKKLVIPHDDNTPTTLFKYDFQHAGDKFSDTEETHTLLTEPEAVGQFEKYVSLTFMPSHHSYFASARDFVKLEHKKLGEVSEIINYNDDNFQTYNNEKSQRIWKTMRMIMEDCVEMLS